MDNFGQYAEFVADVAKEMTQRQRTKFPLFDEWAIAWRKLYDNFNKVYESDPMVIYRPKHRVAHEFHSSKAFIRYFRAGNRTSKTQSGYAEQFYHLTGGHPWRTAPLGHTFIVGLEYAKYAPNVFERKMLTGESGNPVSPMFPPGGKWFHHYDERKKILTVACKLCAEAGKAGTCKHQKSSVSLFSDEVGWEQLQGAVYVLGHFDEHIDESWYDESRIRLSTIANSSMIITGTPLFGYESWENRRVADIAVGPPEKNRQVPDKEDSAPLVSLHEISMYDAGIVPKEVVDREKASMDEFAIEARIFGRPAPSTRNPVFDRHVLAEMRKACRPAKYVRLTPKPNKHLEDVSSENDLEITRLPNDTIDNRTWTGCRIWEEPDINGQYIAAVDSARGLTDKDASCCSILKIENRNRKMHLTLVAQYYGWLNGFLYADEIYKLAVVYNSAQVIVELTGGFGDAVILRLKQLCYWNIYREMGKRSYAEFAEDVRFGVDTNAATKGFMVTALQQFVRDRCLTCYDRDTINELANFTQENATKEGMRLVTPRFHGAGGSRDDRVMSLVIGASVAVSTPVFDFQAESVAATPANISPAWKGVLDDLASDQVPPENMTELPS